MQNVTLILAAIEEGDPSASEQLLPLIYQELRRLAAQKMAQESPDQTLQATALVHEAYLRLVDGARAGNWNSRGHFFSAAAEAMRRILVERARSRASLKGGGLFQRRELGDIAASTDESPDRMLDLNESLMEFEREEPEKAELVKLRYFAGLSLEESAKILGISTATAKRHWVYARAWLYGRICEK